MWSLCLQRRSVGRERVTRGARPGLRHGVLHGASDPLLARQLALLRFREAMDLRHVLVGDLAGDLLGRRVATDQLRVSERLGLAVVEVRLEASESAEESGGALHR